MRHNDTLTCPQNSGKPIYEDFNFKIFRRRMPPDPPTADCLWWYVFWTPVFKSLYPPQHSLKYLIFCLSLVANNTRVIPSSCMSMLVFSRFLARATSWSVILVQIRILHKQKKKNIFQQLPYIITQLKTSDMKDPYLSNWSLMTSNRKLNRHELMAVVC